MTPNAQEFDSLAERTNRAFRLTFARGLAAGFAFGALVASAFWCWLAW